MEQKNITRNLYQAVEEGNRESGRQDKKINILRSSKTIIKIHR
jgi:hypothetical protein